MFLGLKSSQIFDGLLVFGNFAQMPVLLLSECLSELILLTCPVLAEARGAGLTFLLLTVVIHGLPGSSNHEWHCPVAIEMMAAMAADRPTSRSQSSLSRKSSNSSRKSSAPAQINPCKITKTD